ncbi:MAG: hypothetical protein HY237_14920 [Acidobacteria bacterium]|nr:hypothetical protein [Acidobacteriota bacterium]
MSVHATLRAIPAPAVDPERRHRRRLLVCWALAMALVLALAAYGFDYYTLDAAHRPLSAKHQALKPSGRMGIRLGMLGALLFLGIYLYPIRKRWPWLTKKGSSRHWLDFHVILGLTAPLVIAFHSAFKFHGIAGTAFWIMAAVALSGVVGRYLYAQIPRSLSAAEISLKELQEEQRHLMQKLAAQKVFPAASLAPVFQLPTAQVVQHMSLLRALDAMIALDLGRPFRVAQMRRRALGLVGSLLTFGGLLRTGNPELERVVRTARQQAALSKRILFLSRSQQVFHLWHVVHRPFSYAFALLASIHILVVLLLGYL